MARVVSYIVASNHPRGYKSGSCTLRHHPTSGGSTVPVPCGAAAAPSPPLLLLSTWPEPLPKSTVLFRVTVCGCVGPLAQAYPLARSGIKFFSPVAEEDFLGSARPLSVLANALTREINCKQPRAQLLAFAFAVWDPTCDGAAL